MVVNALAESPWGVFSISLTIPIALFMGFYLRHMRPGRIMEVTAIGVALLLLAVMAVASSEMGLDDADALEDTLVLSSSSPDSSRRSFRSGCC